MSEEPPPPSAGDLRRHPDGRLRCAWAGDAADYVAYHDDEWGAAVHEDVRLFEKLSLEAFQSGLSWLTILRKREAFRAAFARFEPSTVAGFGAADVDRLLQDTGIVRNRAKIEAVIHNAGRLLELVDEVGSLDEHLWSFAPPARRWRPSSLADVPSSTAESAALARDLKRRGWRFIGPTTAYAMMQAVGMVDDHLDGCWVPQRRTPRPPVTAAPHRST